MVVHPCSSLELCRGARNERRRSSSHLVAWQWQLFFNGCFLRIYYTICCAQGMMLCSMFIVLQSFAVNWNILIIKQDKISVRSTSGVVRAVRVMFSFFVYLQCEAFAKTDLGFALAQETFQRTAEHKQWPLQAFQRSKRCEGIWHTLIYIVPFCTNSF